MAEISRKTKKPYARNRKDSSSEEEPKPAYPPPPVFNSLPSSLEFVHRMIIKCTDPKFMQEKPAKKK